MAYRRTIAAGASEDRLTRLIEERLKPGADKEKIDGRIWDLFGEEWCVMFTDLAASRAEWRNSASSISSRRSWRPNGS